MNRDFVYKLWGNSAFFSVFPPQRRVRLFTLGGVYRAHSFPSRFPFPLCLSLFVVSLPASTAIKSPCSRAVGVQVGVNLKPMALKEDRTFEKFKDERAFNTRGQHDVFNLHLQPYRARSRHMSVMQDQGGVSCGCLSYRYGEI